MKNFWTELPKPFVVLAPMANVTDCVYRRIIAKYGCPDVFWTEFVSADGLVSSGREHLLIDLKFSPKEKPIVAQLFTAHDDAMNKAAALVLELKFSGLDINMGCPDKAVEKQGAGAALIKNPKQALAVIEAARAGVQNKIPVSVKTRLGYREIDMEWIKTLLKSRLPALTVHLRTRKEMSEVAAHWDIMPEIVKLRNEISPETLIIGNGDVDTPEQAFEYCRKYGCDGVMIGRGIFGKPWLFECLDERRMGQKVPVEKSPAERLSILLEHAKLYEKTFSKIKSFDIMKKHFKAYVSGWEGSKELRIKLMECKDAKSVERVLQDIK